MNICPHCGSDTDQGFEGLKARNTFCLARYKGFYECCKEAGHEGDHAAYVLKLEQHPIVTWPQTQGGAL